MTWKTQTARYAALRSVLLAAPAPLGFIKGYVHMLCKVESRGCPVDKWVKCLKLGYINFS